MIRVASLLLGPRTEKIACIWLFCKGCNGWSKTLDIFRSSILKVININTIVTSIVYDANASWYSFSLDESFIGSAIADAVGYNVLVLFCW